MPESEYSQGNLAYIRTHVEQIERLSRFSVAANPGCRAYVEESLKERKGAAKLYLTLASGPKNQLQLQKETRQSQATVSKILRHLMERGMLATVPSPEPGAKVLYIWSELEQLVGVSRIARSIVRK